MSEKAKDTQEQEKVNEEPQEEVVEKEETEAVDETEEQEQESNKQERTAGKESKDRQVEELGRKLAEINDRYLRLSAEFDNYRKRTLKEKMELTKSAGEQVLTKILPVMDNFERALKSIETAKDVPALRQGVELIYQNFKDFLGQNGVKEMECTHVDFDPELHEAVTKIPAPTEELKGKIVDCVQKGYTLNDKVVRYPKVVVGE